ncbi:hypothetical protein [Fulvivirga sediminis]|uniref:Small multi-drug export protein n=1 Tax=Fulvivirga sediminis TaxID=2803949 RepID=A0A937FAF7_9BACT|nr:hypothetical protein [Fulvivirga sediminis]MBL3656983.1 hypothetical protein [Fulvivirga sediminis]
MEPDIFKVLSIILLTMLKFIAGPTLGFAGGFSLLNTILITITGMMCSVFLFTFLGDFLREKVFARFFKKKRRFTKRSRQFVTIWKKYGIVGVAALTPLIFTPIGGTILLSSMGTPKKTIIFVMLLSAIFWACFFSSIIHFFGMKILPEFMQ